jgi:TolB-like protein/Tfp pilus assembly protein PilF
MDSTPHKSADIFLSYNREDQAVARRFAESFEQAGFSVWWDVTLRSGETYDQVTEEALRAAKAVVVLWSKRSVKSEWVRSEASIALRNKTLLPAMIELCDRPVMFELKQTADLCHWQGAHDDSVWLAFVSDVQRFVDKPAHPAANTAAVTGALVMPMATVSAHSAAVTPLSATVTNTEQQPSIAVLPFANLSGDKEQEYFSDGLAEELINALAKISGLRVIARSSAFAFRTQSLDARQIAGKLGVAHVLEGSVRRSGNRIRVTAQLIAAKDGTQLWSERYDRELEDVFAVQDDISNAIAAALQVKLAPVAATAALYTPTLPAYEALLKARHLHWMHTPESMEQATGFYEQAITLDPRFALAHAEYAELLMGHSYMEYAHQSEMAPLSRAQALKALELDPSLSEAHGSLCAIAATHDRDWPEAHRQFLLATSGSHSSPLTRRQCGWTYLLASGQVNEAVRQLQLAVQADPLHLEYRSVLGACLDAAGRHDEAAGILLQTLEFAPGTLTPTMFLTISYYNRGMFADALALAESMFVLAPFYPLGLSLYAGLLTRTGQPPRGQTLLQRLRPGSPGVNTMMATYYLLCDELDQAANWFEQALASRDANAMTLMQLTIGKELRASKHWPKLAALMNLPLTR